MWNRKDLKTKGKIAFKANYWRSVLVAFLATILTSAGTTVGNKQSLDSATNQMNISDGQALLLAGVVIVIVVIALAIGTLLDVFVANPLSVGCTNFFLINRSNPSVDCDPLGFGFKSSYKNIVLVMFMTKLFIFLWSLLFIVPGIIKAYEYRMVRFLLTEDPDMDYHEALQRSKELMMNQKWNTFVLDLSFLGWEILGALTFGILTYLYVLPYIQATNTELYVALAHPEESDLVLNNADVREEPQTVEFEVSE